MARLTREGTLCGVCMDTTHLFHETPQDFLDRCGKWVINTHLSDYLNGQETPTIRRSEVPGQPELARHF